MPSPAQSPGKGQQRGEARATRPAVPRRACHPARGRRYSPVRSLHERPLQASLAGDISHCRGGEGPQSWPLALLMAVPPTNLHLLARESSLLGTQRCAATWVPGACVQGAEAVDLAAVYRWLLSGRADNAALAFNLPHKDYLQVRAGVQAAACGQLRPKLRRTPIWSLKLQPSAATRGAPPPASQARRCAHAFHFCRTPRCCAKCQSCMIWMG